jgi:hypothetical protein
VMLGRQIHAGGVLKTRTEVGYREDVQVKSMCERNCPLKFKQIIHWAGRGDIKKAQAATEKETRVRVAVT